MEITSYLLGKKAGGGGGATLIEKNITSNNTYNASDDNADGYSKVVVNVPTPTPNLQSKSETITTDTKTTITADTGYDGLSGVEITTNVGSYYFNNILSNGLSNKASGLAKMVTHIPENTIVSGDDLTNAFYYCEGLTTIPLIDTSGVVNMNSMFRGCDSLVSIPLIDTSSVQNMSYMFSFCSSLTTIPQLDTSSVQNMSYMFTTTTNLSDESLNNILAMCIGATSYTGTKKLQTLFSPQTMETYSSRVPNLSNYQAFLNAGWTIS